MTDFFEHRHDRDRSRWTSRRYSLVTDTFVDLWLRCSGVNRAVARLAASLPPQRILIVGVSVPSRPGDMEAVVEQYGTSKHSTKLSIVDMANRGKFENINLAIKAANQLNDFDWLLITDDDVSVGSVFLDSFVAVADHYKLKIAQPAHRYHSYSTFSVTQRRPGVARRTRFVEIGPVTLLHRDTFHALVPFPELRWGWGLDLLWSQIASDHNWSIGVVDAVTMRHQRPVAGGYRSDAAIAEAKDFLARSGVTLRASEVLGPGVSLPISPGS